MTNDCVVSINDVKIKNDVDLKSFDLFNINKAFLLSIAAKALKKDEIVFSADMIFFHYDEIKLYITNPWMWYSILQFEYLSSEEYKFGSNCKNIHEKLKNELLKDSCIFTLKLYYCLINNNALCNETSYKFSKLKQILNKDFEFRYSNFIKSYKDD